MTKLYEERINEEKHFTILGDFICGPDDPLNGFLSDDAIAYDEQHLGQTYLIIEDGEIVAFYTLKANGLQIENEQKELEVLPMIEISRIAVAHDLQGNGLGKQIFYELILEKVKQVSSLIAVKGIMVFVEKDNEQGIAFYKSVGFAKADSIVNDEMHGDAFNAGCDLYVVNLEAIHNN